MSNEISSFGTTGVGLIAALAFAIVSPAIAVPDCADSTVGFIPINDLGPGTYLGVQGGLYPGGSNEIPVAHRAARAIDLGPIAPEYSGGPPACTGGGPSGGASGSGGFPSQRLFISAT